MSQETFITEYVIKSEVDNQIFSVNENIINASALLKNLCDLTKVTEPITVQQCSGKSINTFIKLISHYDEITDKHDKEFEQLFFNSFNDEELAELVKDLSILDSEFFMDSVADYILDKISQMKSLEEIQKYLGLENDFTLDERKSIEKNLLEYFLGINFDKFKFPFPEKSLYSIKTKFYSPLNVLFAKIIERSNAEISYLLALSNKAIKKEVDRYPLKLCSFNSGGGEWCLRIFSEFCKMLQWNGFFKVDIEEDDDIKYFDIIKKRKVVAVKFYTDFSHGENIDEKILCSTLDLAFACPTKFQKLEVRLHSDFEKFFMDSVADFILDKISQMKSLEEIQEYLGLENDFTLDERESIEKNRLEYFLGINFDKFEFPFHEKNLYSIKTKFFSPLNVLFAKIIERSNAELSYLLALSNKAIKNEVDRYPLKLCSFKSNGGEWCLRVFSEFCKMLQWNGFFEVDFEEDDDIKYFDIIKKRKVAAKEFYIDYCIDEKIDKIILCSSFDFACPTKCQKLEICLDSNFECIQKFDVQKCPFPSLSYHIAMHCSDD
uniref:Uncharacterized protein n=1 Tax=Panagrolaimus sp. ES5 TaxID=591445 RepID=A0AC34G2N2_9BILA